VKRAQLTAAASTSVQALRQCQAVLLPALFGATLEQTAAVLGVAVRRWLDSKALPQATSALPALAPTGADDGNPCSPKRKKDDFLKPWLASAATGNLVVVSPIQAALAQRLGQPVKPSVVYRLLARHGWRKVAPDTRQSQEQTRGSGGVEKKLPEVLETLLTRDVSRGVTFGLMFQDEARFGRMWIRVRRC